ncbi:MAG: thiolase family protein [Pseudomonadota bacterium]
MRGLDDRVAIVGVGITKHGFFPEWGWKRMIVESAYDALNDAGMDPGEIQAGYISVTASEIEEQQNLGAVAADTLGMVPAGFGQVVSACAGGGVGLSYGVQAIRSGTYNRILVVGFEKISDCMSTAEVLLGNMDVEFEYPLGYDYIDVMALMQTRYMSKYDVPIEPFAQFAVQDRWYAHRNPKAVDYGRPPIAMQDVLEGPMISWPITAAACARACDGSSALIIVPARDARKYTDTPIYIDGISLKTSPTYVGNKFGYPGMEDIDISEAAATIMAAKEAYKQADLNPERINFAQVHDCFTINGVIQLEALGIFPRGQGAAAVASGETALDGRCPTNTDGGRIGLGHPTGTTGINMVAESVIQMRGQAGERQVKKPDVGVCQTMGGTNAASVVTVLRRL